MNECKIVEDLLPLYAEDLISPESKEFVEEHCAGCESCGKILKRTVTEIPATSEDPKAYKSALRKNQFNLICKATLLFVLVVVIMYAGCTKLDSYVKWKEGKAPVEAVFDAPVGNGKVTLVDWEASGWRIGGIDNVGTAIWIKQMDVREDEHSTGFSISEGAYTMPWENVKVYWAPDGVDFLMTADLLEGGYAIFLEDYEQWYDEEGRHHSVSKLLPQGSKNGFVDVLTAHCKELEEFHTDWESIHFTFLEWKEDSETLIFVYETDNGYRGVLDYHFPTDTITKVN